MGTIRLDDLFSHVSGFRSDLLKEQVQWALAEAARKVARDSNILIDEVVFTVEEDEDSHTIVLPSQRAIGTVKKVERYDNDLERWVKLRGPLVFRAEGSEIPVSDSCTPESFGSVGGVIHFGAPSDDQYPMRATVSYVPAPYPVPAEIDFPGVAEDAIVAWAEALVWRIAGKGQNMQLSHSAKTAYEAAISGVCLVAQDGEGAQRTVNDWLPFEA